MLELIIFIIILIVALITLKFILGINIKKVKEIADRKDLDDLTKNLPNTETITKQLLEKLNNTNVKVKKATDDKTQTSLYLVVNNTILLGNMENKYARVQTIAHECLHSIQNKKMLWFNFIYSNIYILYFYISIVFVLLRVFDNVTMQLLIILFLGFIQYVVRAYLENDAMTKSFYLAKEYLEEMNFTKEKTEMLVDAYDKINKQAIPITNYQLFVQIIKRCLIYAIVTLIYYHISFIW